MLAGYRKQGRSNRRGGGFVQDHPDGGPPANPRSGCAVFTAIVAAVLVAIPIVFAVRGLATTCQSPHAGPAWWVRQHCSVGLDRVLATIELCLLVTGVALFGGGIGWLAAARRHRAPRWPMAATGAVITLLGLYAVGMFLTLASIGRWSW